MRQEDGAGSTSGISKQQRAAGGQGGKDMQLSLKGSGLKSCGSGGAQEKGRLGVWISPCGSSESLVPLLPSADPLLELTIKPK